MPHIIVKLYPDRTPEDKERLADNLAALLRDTMGYQAKNVSVSIVEVAPAQWMREVYDRDIAGGEGTLVRPPEYGPLAGGARIA